jgi:hypothetical protein
LSQNYPEYQFNISPKPCAQFLFIATFNFIGGSHTVYLKKYCVDSTGTGTEKIEELFYKKMGTKLSGIQVKYVFKTLC